MGELAVRAVTAASALLFLPVLLFQGKQVRRRTPRLPAAQGESEGIVPSAGPTLHLLIIGESTAVGVGVSTHAQGLASQTARALVRKTNRSVHWMVFGKIGATAKTACEQLTAELKETRPDVVVIALGVNDTLRFTTPGNWHRHLRRLIGTIRDRAGSAIVLISSVPPLGRFSNLPQPLRGILGLRALSLDLASKKLARRTGNVIHVAVTFDGGEELFCEDRFHPSIRGYETWGEHLAEAVAPLLDEQSKKRVSNEATNPDAKKPHSG